MSESYSEAEAREIIRQSVVDEKLIEEAAKAMWAANGPEDWDRATGAEQAEHLTLASAALAVFEKAQTPTDDEREALATILGEPVRGTLALADRILAAGFRRFEVPESQGEPFDPNEHTPACDAWADMNGSGCTCHVEQGEPSDAQVDAALLRFSERRDETWWDAMRAALRAAGEVR